MVTVPEPLENGVVQGVIENKDTAEMERDAMVLILTHYVYIYLTFRPQRRMVWGKF